MSGFLLPAALLVLLAVAFAISALWQKSRGLAIAIAVVLPLAAAGLYAWRGTPAALDAAPAPAPVADTSPTAAAPVDPAQAAAEAERLIADLEARLETEPGRWEGWALLGRVRMEQGRFDDARIAFAKAHELAPDNHAVGVGYAEAQLRASPDKRFPPEAVALLEASAQADPPDEKGVFLLGMHRLLSGDPGAAADLWESLLPQLDPKAAEALMPQITAARAAAEKLGQAEDPAANAGPGPAISVTVTLAPAMVAKARPGAVLYVFARSPDGGPPVAVERVVPAQWPVVVTLDDADRPMPTMKLSDHNQVTINARLSMSGDAIAMAGDIESPPITIATDDPVPVRLRLDQVRP
jgi:cytochrome c-type biogenesis protein CcmH